jgi:hypothetical protein
VLALPQGSCASSNGEGQIQISFNFRNNQTTMTGIELIAEERQRQQDIGPKGEAWDSSHDDQHDEGELLKAALCYIRFALASLKLKGHKRKLSPPPDWPWEREWWKPHENQSDLARAGALIAAEIDRLQRL